MIPPSVHEFTRNFISYSMPKLTLISSQTSRFEKELIGISGFSNEEILSSESYEPNSNDWDNVKHSSTYDQKVPPYSEQWTWPNSENSIKKIPSPYMIRSDQRYFF